MDDFLLELRPPGPRFSPARLFGSGSKADLKTTIGHIRSNEQPGFYPNSKEIHQKASA
jgi:hypothetical protein